jgi:predicted nucleotidyltransferase
MVTSTSEPLSRAEIDRALCEAGSADPRIVALYLFGSRGRGDETPESDVDVGVLWSVEQPLRETLLLEDLLVQRLGREVDVVDAGKANAFLALDVIRGQLVHCVDADRADAFELYVMRRAGDLAPFERERRRLALQPRVEVP